MLHKYASKSIWIGKGIFTLCTMETSHSLLGAIVVLQSNRVNNNEIAPQSLEIV